MRLTIIGCGDAFGAGGRLQSAYLLDVGAERLLVDCGATTSLGLERRGIDPNSIPNIVITHLHGDHFAGIVWFLMQAAIISGRSSPLHVFGPPGIRARVTALAEILYPGIRVFPRQFELQFHDMYAGHPTAIGSIIVDAIEVDHPSGAPSHALRFAAAAKTFAYSGDSQWTEALITAGRDADLFLLECNQYERVSPVHLNWPTIEKHLAAIGARRVMLTHFSSDMLANLGKVTDARVTFAEDGAVIDI